jgi:hypothetical protein
VKRLVAVLLAGCATAGESGTRLPDADLTAIDARPTPVDARRSPADAPFTPVDAMPSPVDAATPVDAMPSPVDAMPAPVDATPCTRVWTPLLANGDFDLGRVDWTEVPAASVLSSSPPLTPHSGAWVAWFDGVNNDDEFLAQDVAVPPTATALRLRGYRCFVTTEVTTTVPYDKLEITAGADTLHVFSNLDGASVCSWSAFSIDAPQAHAGESLAFVVHGTTDGGKPTSFYLDSLVLEALACP